MAADDAERPWRRALGVNADIVTSVPTLVGTLANEPAESLLVTLESAQWFDLNETRTKFVQTLDANLYSLNRNSLQGQDSHHLLVSGAKGVGKSVVLQTVAVACKSAYRAVLPCYVSLRDLHTQLSWLPSHFLAATLAAAGIDVTSESDEDILMIQTIEKVLERFEAHALLIIDEAQLYFSCNGKSKPDKSALVDAVQQLSYIGASKAGRIACVLSGSCSALRALFFHRIEANEDVPVEYRCVYEETRRYDLNHTKYKCQQLLPARSSAELHRCLEAIWANGGDFARNLWRLAHDAVSEDDADEDNVDETKVDETKVEETTVDMNPTLWSDVHKMDVESILSQIQLATGGLWRHIADVIRAGKLSQSDAWSSQKVFTSPASQLVRSMQVYVHASCRDGVPDGWAWLNMVPLADVLALDGAPPRPSIPSLYQWSDSGYIVYNPDDETVGFSRPADWMRFELWQASAFSAQDMIMLKYPYGPLGITAEFWIVHALSSTRDSEVRNQLGNSLAPVSKSSKHVVEFLLPGKVRQARGESAEDKRKRQAQHTKEFVRKLMKKGHTYPFNVFMKERPDIWGGDLVCVSQGSPPTIHRIQVKLGSSKLAEAELKTIKQKLVAGDTTIKTCFAGCNKVQKPEGEVPRVVCKHYLVTTRPLDHDANIPEGLVVWGREFMYNVWPVEIRDWAKRVGLRQYAHIEGGAAEDDNTAPDAIEDLDELLEEMEL